jgi:predicted acyl esterase
MRAVEARLICAAMALASLAAAAPAARRPEADVPPSKPTYAVILQKDVAIPMRDGIELRADIYFPPKDGAVVESKLGTLLQRTPYNKSGGARLGNLYASMGFAVVIQDERGRNASPGKEFKYGEQARDRFEEWLWRLPIRPGLSPFKYFPENEAWFFGTYTNSDYPGPEGFWLKRGWNIVPYYEQQADVATIYIGSWYDTYAQAQTENFSAISKLKKKTPKRLVFHPLGHTEFLNRTWAGDVDFGPEVKWDFETYRIKWYDRFVKGIANDIEKTAPVRVFVMGGGDGRKNIEGHMSRPAPTWWSSTRRHCRSRSSSPVPSRSSSGRHRTRRTPTSPPSSSTSIRAPRARNRSR